MTITHQSSQRSADSLSDTAQFFKGIGDETRIRILGLLRHGELCVCDVMEVLGLPQSTASRHLAYLKNSGWVNGTRKGKWMYYTFTDHVAGNPLHGEILASLSDLGQIKDDYRNLLQHLQDKKQDSCSQK